MCGKKVTPRHDAATALMKSPQVRSDTQDLHMPGPVKHFIIDGEGTMGTPPSLKESWQVVRERVSSSSGAIHKLSLLHPVNGLPPTFSQETTLNGSQEVVKYKSLFGIRVWGWGVRKGDGVKTTKFFI